MTTSLFAVGPAKVEVGKYGMSIDAALESFTKVVEETGNIIELIKDVPNGKRIDLKWNTGPNATLLYKMANVMDLHGDAPDTYILTGTNVPAGEYIRTGSYND